MTSQPGPDRWLDPRRDGRRVRPVVAFFASLALTFGLRAAAFAHLEVLESDPAPDAVLTASPEVIRITFSGRIAPTSQIEVLGPEFQPMRSGPARLATPNSPSSAMSGQRPAGSSEGTIAADPDAERTLVVAVKPLETGSYTVQWVAVDIDDGHRTSGSYAFQVRTDALTAAGDSATASLPSSVGGAASTAVSSSTDTSVLATSPDKTAAPYPSGGASPSPASIPQFILGLGLIVLGALGFFLRSRRRRQAVAVAALAGSLTALGLTACGQSTVTPPPITPPSASSGAESLTPVAGAPSDSAAGSGAAGPSAAMTGTTGANASAAGSGPGSTTAISTTQGPQIAIASSDLAVGHQRFAFAILGPGNSLEKDAQVAVRFFNLAGETPVALGEPMPAAFYPSALENAGLYVVYIGFEQAGMYGAEIAGQLSGGRPLATQRVRFTVGSHSLSPGVGEPPPPTANRTLATETDLAKLTSDPQPDPDFYRLTVDQAARSGKPTVVVFATPGFCQSRICAPVLDEVKAAKAKWQGRVNFIHIEVYKSFAPLVYADEMASWNLETEPWVFVLDDGGKVFERLEGSVSDAELEPILKRVTKTP